jgi:multimeric flavodoxin WrbA
MDKLRFVGINSSPRRHGNTEILVNRVLDSARIEGQRRGYEIELDYVSLYGKTILPCLDCDGCVRNNSYCILKDDWLDAVKHILDPVPNGVVLGSPVYFFNVNSEMRAFMERFTSLTKQIWYKEFPYSPPDWSRTAAGAVTVGYDRNGGQEIALTTMLHFLLLNGFVAVSGEGYTNGYVGVAGWQMGKDGAKRDAVNEDYSAMKSCENLGKRIATTGILLSGRDL